jgi:hypothetical protein
MTNKEQQNMSRAIVKAVRPMRISREEKLAIYYGFVSGLESCEGFNEDCLFDLDLLLNEALRDHKRRVKNRF